MDPVPGKPESEHWLPMEEQEEEKAEKEQVGIEEFSQVL